MISTLYWRIYTAEGIWHFETKMTINFHDELPAICIFQIDFIQITLNAVAWCYLIRFQPLIQYTYFRPSSLWCGILHTRDLFHSLAVTHTKINYKLSITTDIIKHSFITAEIPNSICSCSSRELWIQSQYEYFSREVLFCLLKKSNINLSSI